MEDIVKMLTTHATRPCRSKPSWHARAPGINTRFHERPFQLQRYRAASAQNRPPVAARGPQTARSLAMRAKGQFGLGHHGRRGGCAAACAREIDYPVGSDGLDDAIAASAAYRDAPHPRFDHPRQAFGLDGDDTDLILLALAPEISAGYEKIFAYLNDNLNHAYLTVDLATRILRQERRQRLSLQSRLLPGAQLNETACCC